MTRKKNKFMTFCFSLIPGAGEMYLGFFKQGASIMFCFFFLICVSAFLNMSILLYASPILWFYSFFHTNNLNTLPDDEFYALEDSYLFDWNIAAATGNRLVNKHRRPFAILLIFLGVSIIWNILNKLLFRVFFNYFYVPEYVYAFFRNLFSSVPQILVGVAIIMAGYYLIKNKKEDLDKEEHKENDVVLILEDKDEIK